MPFTSHLVELRNRIFICVITIVLSFFIFFFAFGKPLFRLMEVPLKYAVQDLQAKPKYKDINYKELMISFKPISMFMTSAAVSLLAAVILTVPVTIYQLWMFVAPGLKKRERRMVTPILLFGTFFFVLGAMFCYFVVLRVILGFLLEYTYEYGVAPKWNVGDLVKFESVLLLVFGIAFELPLAMVALTRVGILSPEAIAGKRRHVIVIMFIVGAVLTPPDIVSQICLAVPLCLLFELGLQASKFFRRRAGSRWDAFDASVAADEAAHAKAKATTPVAEPPAAPATESGESVHTEPADAYGEGAAYADQQAEAPHVEPTGDEAEGAEPEPPAEPEQPTPAPEEPAEEPEHKPQPPPDDDLPPDAIMH